MPAPNPRHYNVQELQAKLMHVAQTSVYRVSIIPPGPVVSRLRSNKNILWSGATGIQEMVNLSCTDAVLPGSSFATHEVTSDYMGVSEKMAYRRMYNNQVSLSFYVDRDYKIVEFFESWMDFISGKSSRGDNDSYRSVQNGFRANYPIDYKEPLYVTKFEKNLNGRALEYQFIDAFPIATNSMDLSYTSSDLLKLDVEFSFARYVMESKTYDLRDNPLPTEN